MLFTISIKRCMPAAISDGLTTQVLPKAMAAAIFIEHSVTGAFPWAEQAGDADGLAEHAGHITRLLRVQVAAATWPMNSAKHQVVGRTRNVKALDLREWNAGGGAFNFGKLGFARNDGIVDLHQRVLATFNRQA